MTHDEEEMLKLSERSMIRTNLALLDRIRTHREMQARIPQPEQEPQSASTVALLRYISTYRCTHGWSPTLREIAQEHLHHNNPSHARYCVQRLVEAGWLHQEHGPRCIAITKTGRRVLEGSL